MKIIIKKDVFDISNRIKKINKNFEIIFDTVSNKYYVCDKFLHNIIFTLPSKNLTPNVVDYVLKMQSKDNAQILKDIDEHNEKVFNTNKEKIKQSAIQSAEKILRRS